MNRRLMLGVVGLVSVSALVACGDDDDDGASEVAEANTEFCDDLSAYGTAVGDFAALDPATATKDDYDSAAEEVRSTRDAMVESAGDLAETEWENLVTQVDTLRDQLQDAPDDEAVQAIRRRGEAAGCGRAGERRSTGQRDLHGRWGHDEQRRLNSVRDCS